MKFTMKMSIVACAIFSLACLGVAINGFISLGDVSDPVQRADSWGYAWYWMFLALIAALFGVIGVWLVRTEPKP
jgi:hypothetical protein